MLQNYSAVHHLTCVSEKKSILNHIIWSTLKIKKKNNYMSVEGREFPPVGSMKYFKICEGYELKPMTFSRHISSHLRKICSV